MDWTQRQLHNIVDADDLKVAPFRADGVSYGTPTWIWCVAVDDGLYVRGYNGQNSRWYNAAVQQRAGRIIAVGTVHDVEFEPVDERLNDLIDAAYRSKYFGSEYLAPMISARARSATIRITPRPQTT